MFFQPRNETPLSHSKRNMIGHDSRDAAFLLDVMDVDPMEVKDLQFFKL